MASNSPATPERSSNFLFAVAIFTLVYVVAGFALRSAIDPTGYARLSPPVILHALLMTAWLALYARQVALKRRGDITRHRQHGQWILAVGAGIIVTGFYITWRAAPDLGGTPFMVFNGIAFLVFGLLVALAFTSARKHRYDRHKRFMLVATLTFVGPASARWLAALGGPPLIAPLIMIAAVWLIPFVFDRADRDTWQSASKLAAAIVVGSLVLGGVIAASLGVAGMAPPEPASQG